MPSPTTTGAPQELPQYNNFLGGGSPSLLNMNRTQGQVGQMNLTPSPEDNMRAMGIDPDTLKQNVSDLARDANANGIRSITAGDMVNGARSQNQDLMRRALESILGFSSSPEAARIRELQNQMAQFNKSYEQSLSQIETTPGLTAFQSGRRIQALDQAAGRLISPIAAELEALTQAGKIQREDAQQLLSVMSQLQPKTVGSPITDAAGNVTILQQDPMTGEIFTQSLGQIAPAKEKDYTPDVQEYLFAKENGYTGDFLSFIRKKSLAEDTNGGGGISGISGIPSSLGTQGTVLADAFNNAVVRLPKDRAARASQQFQQYLSSGNTDAAKQYLQSVVLSSIPAADYSKVAGRFEGLAALDEIEGLIDTYESAGGNTGILTGSSEAILNKLGKTKDPVLAEVENAIKLAIFSYRNAVSGAAFTESEGKAYEEAFPSIGKGGELNKAKVASLRSMFNRNNRVAVETIIGPGNYDAIFAQKTSQSPQGAMTVDSYLDTQLSSVGGTPSEQKSAWSRLVDWFNSPVSAPKR